MNASLAAALTVVMTLTLVLAPVAATAQEPVKSFDQLNTRLKVGDTIWVTDAQGREVKGKIQGLGAASLTLEARTPLSFAASDVRVIQERRPDSVKNGGLWGLGVGDALSLLVLTAGGGACGGGCAASTFVVYGAMGAAIGVGIDALNPGKKQAVYRAPGSLPSARLSFAPVITPRHKGVAVSFSF